MFQDEKVVKMRNQRFTINVYQELQLTAAEFVEANVNINIPLDLIVREVSTIWLVIEAFSGNALLNTVVFDNGGDYFAGHDVGESIAISFSDVDNLIQTAAEAAIMLMPGQVKYEIIPVLVNGHIGNAVVTKVNTRQRIRSDENITIKNRIGLNVGGVDTALVHCMNSLLIEVPQI